jgi:biopolymer transport protein ExbD
MKLQAARKHEPSIPTASMADIAFLLIIFFMLTITFEVDKTRVQLPKTTVRVEVPKKAAYVVLDKSGRIKVSDGEELSVQIPGAEETFSFAAGVVATDPMKEFVLKADEGVAYRDVDAVIDALKRAKVRTIYLLSNQRTVQDMAVEG